MKPSSSFLFVSSVLIVLVCVFISVFSGVLIYTGHNVGVITSDSMKGTIDVGDFYLLNTDYKKLSEGDIVSFRRSDGETVCHRIVNKTDKGWITKGDNNPISDQNSSSNYDYVQTEDIRGKVKTVIHIP